MQALQKLVVPVRTPFSVYLSEFRLLVGNTRCIGHVAPDDGTMQIAIKTGVDDQFAGLSAQLFAGRNMRALLFDSVDELMGSLEDLAMNQTRATASVRLAGGMTTRSNVYQQAFRSKQFGGIVTVTADPFEDEVEEFSRVCDIFKEKGGFGRNNKDPLFYVPARKTVTFSIYTIADQRRYEDTPNVQQNQCTTETLFQCTREG